MKQEERKKPKLRFPGFADDWKQRKLFDVTEEFQSGKFIAAVDIKEIGEYPVYGGNGLRGYCNTYNHDGDFALIGRQGALCGNVNYSHGKAYFTEHAIAVKANSSSNTKFLYYLLDKMNLGQYSDQSAQPGLAVGKLVKLESMFPSKPEQDRIEGFLTNLDYTIALHQRKLDAIKEYKRGMLQKMFPKKGEGVPEIRFPGFSGYWKQRKLGDCFDERTERSQSDDDELLSVTISDGVIKQKDSDKRNTASANTSNYKMVYPGDIAYNSMRMWQGAEGVSNYHGIVSPAYTVVKPKHNMDSFFFAFMFKQEKMLNVFERNSQGLTSDTWNLKFPAFSKILVMVPTLNEQQKISELLMDLDRTITLYQCQLEQIKDYKKGLLQKMFV